jgi:hypothetical protein
MHVIFFEIPRIEELQDPSSSPRREEVGRRTLGSMEASYSHFFIGLGFESHEHYSKTSS